MRVAFCSGFTLQHSDGVGARYSPLSRETLPTTVTIGGVRANGTFAGMTPTYVGLVQVNFQFPDLTAGAYPIEITIGAARSNTPLVDIGP